MTFKLLEEILRYISLVTSLMLFAFSVVMFIYNFFKKKQKKLQIEENNEILQDKLEDTNASYVLVNEIIPLAIKKAEEMPLIDGPTKKLLAMSEILQAKL